MAVTQTAQACDLVIFGAKGDLARRKLLPSLSSNFQLFETQGDKGCAKP